MGAEKYFILRALTSKDSPTTMAFTS